MVPGTLADVDWGFIWLMVVLKVPVGMLLWICWWAVRAQVEEPEPPPAEEEGEGGGSDRLHRAPLGRGPRPRGPHGDGVPASPPRTRVPAPPRRAPVR